MYCKHLNTSRNYLYEAPKVLSENAIDQRLRRACSVKGKRCTCSGGPEAAKLYEDLENRPTLARLLIDSGFAQAHPSQRLVHVSASNP